MGIRIGTGNTDRKTIELKGRNGSVVGSISVSKPSKKKMKRLNYNFKEISAQIMRTKTPANAKTVVSRARSKVALLRQKLENQDYDSKEIESAIAHALKIEKIAKKRMKHLQQEERIKQKSDKRGYEEDPLEEEQEFEEDFSTEPDIRQKEQELERLMQEYEKFMQESMKESMEKVMEETEEMLENGDLQEEIIETAPQDMSPEDLELLKKKHRAKELKEIMEADLQYLRAMFDRLAKEKQAAANGSFGSSADNTGNTSGVSLELGGTQIPVQAAEAPLAAEGTNMDVMV